VFLYFSLFLAAGKEGEEQRDIMQEDVGYTSTDSSHDASYMSWEYSQAVSEIGPTIAVGSEKAQGLKAKPVNGSEPPRATRVRDEVTHRVATS
jgi:hypothetical protein